MTLGLCLTSVVANAAEFDCTMSKFGYVHALDPLVPELLRQHSAGDYTAMHKAKQSLKWRTADIYKDCERIRSTKDLDAVITDLAVGTIELHIASEKDNN